MGRSAAKAPPFPMSLRLFLPAMVALVAFSGCASKSSDPLAARRKAYQRLASFLEPGMTRRQLYALLPPAKRPMAQSCISTSGAFPPACMMDREWYPLDQNLTLQVSYRLANPREYPVTSSSKFPAHPTPKEIDALLFPRLVPSRENPNDVLLERPHVFVPATGGALHAP